MPFDSIISRADASALIPEQIAAAIVTSATEQSAALALFRRAAMSSKTLKQPVLASLPTSFWVAGDTGLKQTTKVDWGAAELTAEELASITPIPENVLADASFPVWNEVRPAVAESIGVKIDAAALAGDDAPDSWPPAIVPEAIRQGQVIELGSTPAQGGVTADLDELLSLVETAGRDVTAIAASIRLKGLLRSARDAQGNRLVDRTDRYVDVPIRYVLPEVLPDDVLAVAGDYSLGILGVRSDLVYKILDQAVLTDDQGRIIYNLPQQDMLALRTTMRVGFAVAEPATRRGNGYPFAVLKAADDSSTRTAAKREPAAKK